MKELVYDEEGNNVTKEGETTFIRNKHTGILRIVWKEYDKDASNYVYATPQNTIVWSEKAKEWTCMDNKTRVYTYRITENSFGDLGDAT